MNEKSRWIRRVLKVCGSIYFGVAIAALLAVAMGWATFIEREMGTPVAQRVVYAANWFYVLIGALAANVLCSALVRVRRFVRREKDATGRTKIVVEKRLIPFYLTHLGVVLLILGCWATARLGVRARMTIPEGTAVDKAVDVDSRLFEIELTDATRPDAAPTKIEIPFAGGPLNWRDLRSAKNWNENVARPTLDQMKGGSFFKDLGKSVAKTSQNAARLAANVAINSRSRTLYDKDGLRVEILDYLTAADYAPVPPLKIELTTRRPAANGGEAARETKTVETRFPFDASSSDDDPLATSRRARRLTLDDGARIVYLLADSSAEFNALTSAPNSVEPSSAANSDRVELLIDGTERFSVSLTDLAPLSRSGPIAEQRVSLETQRAEIARRLLAERERSDASTDENAESPRPLQTVSEERLAESGDRLREASEQLEASARGDAAARNEARRRFAERRTRNYLEATWARLEAATPTSREFCETLDKMAAQTDERLAELERLEAATTLGKTGWKIVAFDVSPTLVSGVEELQGWTASLQLESPQGDTFDATLCSELSERNRYPENGRVFGALWVAPTSDSENEYGRRWSESLGKPKLELIQAPNGDVAYRYNAGDDRLQIGRLNDALVPIKGEEGVFAFARTPERAIALKNPEKTDAETFESFAVEQLALHDELGARLVPTPFQKETANEFYGKAKIRVSFDGRTSETFWLRTIPLESATPEQIEFLTKTVSVPSKNFRFAKIRLTDRELSLGAALFVKKFTPVYEPGSTTAVSFSSLVRVLEPGLSPEKQAEVVAANPENDLLIRMNRPGVLRAPGSGRRYWAYQDSFRGPFAPGDKEFDEIVGGKLLPGETAPRENLYYTIVTLNADPGRGLKYFASLLIVWGTALLIYRKKKTAKSAPQTTEKRELSEKMQTKTLVAPLVLALAFASASASAQETRLETSQASAVASVDFDWTPWRLLPVFDGGRRQPLNSFAEILVRDVCGTNAPTFAVPKETLERLESGKTLNFPELDEFLKDVAPAEKEKQTAWYREVSATVVARQRETAAKIRAEFPNGVRKFGAAELLFSWVVEPEIWEYVPFVADDKGAVGREVFKRSPLEIAKRLGRLAPEDFELSNARTKRSLVDEFNGSTKTDAETTAARSALAAVENRLASFRSVAFIPTQTPSTRPRFYLNKILFADASAGPAAFHTATPSPIARLDATERMIERLLVSEDKELRKTSPFSNKEFLLRKTTPLSGANGESSDEQTLLLARQINLLAKVYADYPLPTTGKMFERLYVSTSDALAELRAHRDEILVAESFSTPYRQAIQQAVAELSEVVENIELAYLALAVERPKELDVVPNVRRRDFRSTEGGQSPWLALQTLLWAPDSLYVRFVEPALSPSLLGLRETPSIDASVAKKLGDEKNLQRDELTISPFAPFDEALKKTLDSSRCDRVASTAFLDAATAYRDKTAPDRAARFNAAIRRFSDALRELAAETAPLRVALASEETSDERSRAEFLAKTAYPEPGELDAEFFYYRLNPFFWNWVACLLAVVAFALSYLRQGVAALRARTAPNLLKTAENKDVQDVKTVRDGGEERLFFALGLFFLAASVVVAFWGGAIRAYITGWAPVTNMFETVVLLALLIAAIAIGFALYPIWGEPFANAWRLSAFPFRRRDFAPDERRASRILCLPRVAAIGVCFVATAKICYSEQVFDGGLVDAILESFAMQGVLDRLAVVATFAFVVWSVPRFLCAIFAAIFFAKTVFPRDETGVEFWRERSAQVVRRKAFLTSSAVVALLVAASAYFNSSEFNPNIRPLVAVLRSNFWLTIHVFAIIVSYALGSIAWIVALTSLTAYIFGRYKNASASVPVVRSVAANVRDGKKRSKKVRVADAPSATLNEVKQTACDVDSDDWEPAYCRRVAPIVAAMVRSAVLFLTVGIILGARWADFSWGRFWSWDPKEVWALVTLLIYLVVLHALKSRNGGRFGLTVGAVLGALAIVTTWYGLSFVMGGGGRHAYAAGESNKVAVLYIAFALNIGWTLLAAARYWLEKGRRAATRRRPSASNGKN